MRWGASEVRWWCRGAPRHRAAVWGKRGEKPRGGGGGRIYRRGGGGEEVVDLSPASERRRGSDLSPPRWGERGGGATRGPGSRGRCGDRTPRGARAVVVYGLGARRIPRQGRSLFRGFGLVAHRKVRFYGPLCWAKICVAENWNKFI